MKFSIKNLGRIDSADLEIKPLTIFVGKNNTNKTWTAYALYGILRSLTWFQRSGFVGSDSTRPECGQLDSVVRNIARRTAERLAEAEKDGQDTGTTAQPGTGGQQQFTLEVTRQDILSESQIGEGPISFSLGGATLAKILAVDPTVVADSQTTLFLDPQWFVSHGKVKSLIAGRTKNSVSLTWSSTTSTHHSQLATISSLSDKLTVDYIYEQIIAYIRWLAFAVLNDALSFPAERKAISALLSLLETKRDSKDAKLDDVLNVPSIDFIRFMLSARNQLGVKSANLRIIEQLETGVLNGHIEFQGPPEARVLNYQSASGPQIGIHAVASLVRALAGFDVYLRHHSHDVMVIDEPEMNAHPDAQLKLAEIFAMLVNQGMRIIVTTHSPYFLDHLNNLIEGGKLSGGQREALADKTKLHDRGAFISPDKVAAYLFGDDGSVTNILKDDSLDVSSFGDESDYVSNFYADILDASKGHGDGV